MDMTNAHLQTPNLQTPKPTTPPTTTTKNTKNKALSPNPDKATLNAKQAERLQTMTPNKKHHKTQRGTHIKIGKLTVNQNQKQTNKHQKVKTK
jgi:heme-binding NEAT domain protein